MKITLYGRAKNSVLAIPFSVIYIRTQGKKDTDQIDIANDLRRVLEQDGNDIRH